MLKSIMPNVALSIGGIIATLLLLEIGVRFLPLPYPETRSSPLICSSELGWRGDPNHKTTFETEGYEHTVKLNEAGMHDTDHKRDKPANTLRVLMLGDSFVQASQVNESETSHQILENLLNDGDNNQQLKQFEVISAGVHRWGTAQQLVYYRTEGRHYQPDLVLLMVYLGNDVQDSLPGKIQTADGVNCYAPYFALCDGQLDTDPWTYAPGVHPVMGECPFGKNDDCQFG